MIGSDDDHPHDARQIFDDSQDPVVRAIAQRMGQNPGNKQFNGSRHVMAASQEALLEHRKRREDLLLSSWLTRPLPERDHLLGAVLCSTSRWLIFGDTGVGKTLLAMAIAAAVSAGMGFLDWPGGRKARVMYLDGELPSETFKERMQLLARTWGDDLDFFGYCRDALGPDDLPPLNTPEGQAWLWREIDAIKPDLIVFDSLMCLLAGSLKDDETWAPMKAFVRQLSGRRIAQIWLNHTGHDASHSFGDKSREWEMDTVLGLFKVDESNPADTAVRMEFRKSRLKTPANSGQFAIRVVRLGLNEEWFIDREAKAGGGKAPNQQTTLERAIRETYGRLSDDADESPGFNGRPVRKVKAATLRDEVRDRGYLDHDNGKLREADRKAYARAKLALISRSELVEADGYIWKIRT